MGKIRKGLLSMLFALAMVVSVMPVSAESTESSETPVYDELQAMFNTGSVTLTKNYEVEAGKTISVTGAVTLDLAGFTISGTDINPWTGGSKYNYGLIELSVGDSLTVKDTSNGKTGLITLAANGYDWSRSSSVIENNQGTVVVESGTIRHTGVTDSDKTGGMYYAIDNLTNSGIGVATTTINGGTIESTYRAIRQYANCTTKLNTLTVNGGTITSTSGNKGAIWLQSSNDKANKAQLNISGDAKVSAVYVWATTGANVENLAVSIDPETITGAVTADLGSDQKQLVITSNGKYGIVSTPSSEDSLQKAVDKGGEIVLSDNIDLSTAVEVTKDVQINLNGKSLSLTENNTFGAVFYVTSGTLTINGDGTIDGASVGNNYDNAIWADGGHVVINGGTYTNVGAGDENHYDLIYVKHGGTVTINGGEFISHIPKWTLNSHDTEKGSFVVNGGKFKGYNPASSDTEPGDELVNFVADGYVSNKTGEYYVVSKATATTSTKIEELVIPEASENLTIEVGVEAEDTDPVHEIEIDQNVIAAITSAMNSNENDHDVVFVIEPLTTTEKIEINLKEEQLDTLEEIKESETVTVIIKAEIHVDDATVTDFYGGIVTIKHFVGTGLNKTYKVWHIADDGYKSEILGVTYDAVTGYVSIPCTHFSEFVITEAPIAMVVEPAKSTVEFVVDGKVWRTYRVTKGADIRMPEVPEKEGYVGEWDHDGENIRTATTITAVYTKVSEPVNNTDLSDYANFQLPVYANSRVTNIATANGSITVDGYMFKANADCNAENSIWREIIFVNEEDYSMAKAYRKQVTPVYNTWLNKNMTATGNGTYALDYANYSVTFSNTDINNYVGNTPATKMASGSYLAYMRISDGTNSYLFPLKDIVLSDGSTLALPSGFEVVDGTTRALRYIVK